MMSPTKFEKLANNRLKMKIFMLSRLPLAFLAQLSIDHMDRHKSAVSLPYNYLTKNPFRSIYFAALSMAAELSTGILALAHVEKSGKQVSMLVLGMRAEFLKKAKSRIVFTCDQGDLLEKTIADSISENTGKTSEVYSSGIDSSGDIVAKFWFTWTFKPK